MFDHCFPGWPPSAGVDLSRWTVDCLTSVRKPSHPDPRGKNGKNKQRQKNDPVFRSVDQCVHSTWHRQSKQYDLLTLSQRDNNNRCIGFSITIVFLLNTCLRGYNTTRHWLDKKKQCTLMNDLKQLQYKWILCFQLRMPKVTNARPVTQHFDKFDYPWGMGIV